MQPVHLRAVCACNSIPDCAGTPQGTRSNVRGLGVLPTDHGSQHTSAALLQPESNNRPNKQVPPSSKTWDETSEADSRIAAAQIKQHGECNSTLENVSAMKLEGGSATGQMVKP